MSAAVAIDVGCSAGVIIPITTTDPLANFTTMLDLRRINVLEQVRKTLEDIEDLAEDFVAKGMMHPVQVAYLTKRRAIKHLVLVNRLWGTRYTIRDLKLYSSQTRRYAILITGHRRFAGHMRLWEHGCTACFTKFGQEDPGTCYARHERLVWGQVEAKLYPSITPKCAMEVQCTENIHRSVPAPEQAEAYERLFVTYREDNPALTVAEFARKMGCDADTIRRARRFCALPEHIQSDVMAKRYSYGVALELGRFMELLGPSEATLDSWRQRVIEEGMTVGRLKKLVDDRVKTEASGAVGFAGMDDDELNPSIQEARRHVYERRLTAALGGFGDYLERVRPLLADGTIGPDGEYLDTSTRRIVARAAEALAAVLPDLRLRLEDAQVAASTAGEVLELIRKIDALEAPAEPELFSFA